MSVPSDERDEAVANTGGELEAHGVRAVMILCAGLGTRLRPLTNERAKPMVPVGDRPAVAHVTARARLIGSSRVVVNVHHRPEDLRAWAEAEGVAVSYEAELLGTAGGVAHARELLGEGDVLVWNGDILSELDPRVLTLAHARARRAATLAVLPRTANEGNVGIGDSGEIVRLRGERFGREVAGGDFLGVHVVGAALRERLPPKGCLVGDVYLPLLREGGALHAHEVDVPFTDIGSFAQYLAANAAWLRARGLASWTGPGADVKAPVTGSVIGEGAVVVADAIRCVVWPGARVSSPIADAVITTSGIVARA